MRRVSFCGLVFCLLALLCIPAAYGQANGHRYGAGVFVDRSVPVLGFGDRYPSSQKYGLTFEYKLSSRTTLEFEYHHANMGNGKIENRAFYWTIDKKRYYSPQAESTFSLNSFILNAVVRLNEETGGDTQLIPYVAVGAGFYDYRDRISGLIYPGQKVEPLDADLLIEPRQDDHTPLGATLGLGATVIQGKFGLDIRARYHMALGDLRPMEAWDLETVFPISMVDVRTTFKVYW